MVGHSTKRLTGSSAPGIRNVQSLIKVLQHALFCHVCNRSLRIISWARPTLNSPCISPQNSVTCNGEYRRPGIKAQRSFHDVEVATSFAGSLFSASLGRWKKDPGCGWSCDHPESGWQKSLLDSFVDVTNFGFVSFKS